LRRTIIVKQLIALTAAFIVAACGLASAAGFRTLQSVSPDAKSHAHAGLVDQDGKIVHGSGFTVDHTRVGEYALVFPAGTFKTCPAVTVTPWNIDTVAVIPLVFFYTCQGGGLSATVKLVARSGGTADNAFQFVVNET
jgi:hypothetical protein